jgi:hypothetical protein
MGSVGVAAVGKIGTRPNWALMLKSGTVVAGRAQSDVTVPIGSG